MERDQRTLNQACSFVPWIIQKGIKMETVTNSTDTVVVYRGQGAVVFCDASGFTRLTETLAQKPNGAELLSQVLNQFYTPLVEIISHYRGDIIKFSGDALTILFLAEPDDENAGVEGSEYDLPCGSGWARCSGHSDLELAVLRATACCLEIHKRLDNFDTGIPERTLSFHIGIGCGSCTVLHVGGQASPDDTTTRRFEYVVCGEPLEQISHACHYAEVYETVLSPQAYELVKETVVEGSPISDDPSYRKITGLVTSKHTYATIRAAAQARDKRADQFSLKLTDLVSARRYIPSAVYMQMENGTLQYVNEIRNVSVIFVCVGGVDVSTGRGAKIAQDLMSSVQSACFEQEGAVNKFLVDDKGLLFLCVFGTPPMVHTDDPLRAVNASFGIIQALVRLGLVGNIGVSTGRVFCGLVGSSARQEYTTLGDSVNLAARFMQTASPNTVLVDQATYDQTRDDLVYEILEPVKLKGKSNLIPVFQPRINTSPGGGGRLITPPVSVSGSARSVPIEHAMLNYSFSLEDTVAMIPPAPQEVLMTSPKTSGCQANISATIEDPLKTCGLWKELKQTKRMIDDNEILHSGGTIVFGGQSGLGKEQLCDVVTDLMTGIHKKERLVIVCASERGHPRDQSRPIIELVDACVSIALESGLIDQVEVDRVSGIVHASCEMDLVNVTSSSQSADSIGQITLPGGAAIVTIGDSTLSPSRGGKRLRGRPSIFAPPANLEGDELGALASARRGREPAYAKGPQSASKESELIQICRNLVLKILQHGPMEIVMKSSRGTSLFNIVNNPIFWRLVGELSGIAGTSTDKETTHPLLLVVLCRRTEDVWGIIDDTKTHTFMVDLQPLTRNAIEEYVAKVLQLDVEGANNIPQDLIDFVEDLTHGNPLYIMETLEQLISRKYISRSVSGYVVVNSDLHGDVKVFEWSHTSMVGRVICQLEALAPQESAIVKMATVFEGPFSVLDVAASLKSPYNNAKKFDNYRMYRTCDRLKNLGILSQVENLSLRFPKDTNESFIETMTGIPMFILDNFLIRRVAGGMILQQQALTVKRQALIHRVITTEVRARIEANRKRAANLHMPYYNLVKL